jgi:hypothetical protein
MPTGASTAWSTSEDTWLIERMQKGMAFEDLWRRSDRRSEVCLRSFARKIRAIVPEARLHKAPPAGWSRK